MDDSHGVERLFVRGSEFISYLNQDLEGDGGNQIDEKV